MPDVPPDLLPVRLGGFPPDPLLINNFLMGVDGGYPRGVQKGANAPFSNSNPPTVERLDMTE